MCEVLGFFRSNAFQRLKAVENVILEISFALKSVSISIDPLLNGCYF